MRADAVLLVSFGGPEAPEEVLPFLRRVTAGRGIPDERLAEVGAHYAHLGGVSPLPAQARALRDALQERLDLPVVLCHRNSAPSIADGVDRLTQQGSRRALVLLMSAFPSAPGCRAYRDQLDACRPAPVLDVVGKYGEEEAFCLPFAEGLRAALTPGAAVVFTAHSIPVSQARASGTGDGTDGYEPSLHRACATVCRLAGYDGPWDLVWQSRSGPPRVPWLEPDVGDHAATLAGEGVRELVVVPIGFTSDHVEVVWDLDTALARRCEELGLGLRRVATPGTDPRFVALLADLVRERVDGPGGPGCPGGLTCCRGAG